jgi:hypothetical protein
VTRAERICAWLMRLVAVVLVLAALQQAFMLQVVGFDDAGGLQAAAWLMGLACAVEAGLANLLFWRAKRFGRALAQQAWPEGAGPGLRVLTLTLATAGLCCIGRGLVELFSLPMYTLTLEAIARSARMRYDASWVWPTVATDLAFVAIGVVLLLAGFRIGQRRAPAAGLA